MSATKVDREELARELLSANGSGPAQRLARSLVKGRPDLIEIALDAATDAVMWALGKYNPDRHRSFRGLALRTVKSRVRQRVKNHYRQREDRGEHGNMRDFAEELEGPPPGNLSLPLGTDEILNPREMLAAELCHLGGCTQEEAAKIMGLTQARVNQLLASSAAKLSDVGIG